MIETFQTKVQASRVRFSVPKRICDKFGVKSGHILHLTIKNTRGEELFTDRKYLKSGLEIYGADIRQKGVYCGQIIRVTVEK